MQMDDRKMRVLTAVIEVYTHTGEPVGSKLVSEQMDVSSATVRNEMAALFNMGLLEQPHTSAGRLPSYTGYRLYLDQLMQTLPLTPKERGGVDALFNVRDPDPDKLLEDAAQALAQFTGCAAFTATMPPEAVTVKQVGILPSRSKAVVILIIASNGVVKSRVCRLDFALTPELLEIYNRFATATLVDKSLGEISKIYLNSVAVSSGGYARVLTPILSGVYDLCQEISQGQFALSGEANLLSYKEFQPIAYEVLEFLGDRKNVLSLVQKAQGCTTVTIGRENSHPVLYDSAVVVTRYRIAGGATGAVGLIGPVRQNYAKMIPYLEYFSDTLGSLLAETYDEQQ